MCPKKIIITIMPKNYKKVQLTSSNLGEKKIEKLRHVLPEAFSENKIDWDKLKAALDGQIDGRTEKFSFAWAGKGNAIKNVLVPSKATLRPANDESVDFDKSKNLFIEGDNLEVLKLLQKAYFEQIKMIYIDPPYNTGGDFVYHDDFKAPIKGYLEQTGQADAEGNKLQTNTETSGRYHSDWLTMMYPRLKLAWSLLKPDGVIFISIDDNEVHHLQMMLNEIFGEENVETMVWHKVGDDSGRMKVTYRFRLEHEYILVAYKNKNQVFFKKYKEDRNYKNIYTNPDSDRRGEYKQGIISNTEEKSNKKSERYYTVITPSGKEITRQWRVIKEEFDKLRADNRIYFGKKGDSVPSLKVFINEQKDATPISILQGLGTAKTAGMALLNIFDGKRVFDYPKPVELIKRLIQISTKGSDLILDFFAGSGVTAQAILELNQEDKNHRKFILVQLPEQTEIKSEAYRAGYKTIADIAKERIRRVIKGYGNKPTPINDGFKVFKLGQSNYVENQFEYDPEKSDEENQAAFAKYLEKAKQSSLFPKVKDLDVVYENIVKDGLSLNSVITQNKLGKNSICQVKDGDRELLISLDAKLDKDTIKLLTDKEYKGKTFVCLDNALDDTAKANLGLHVELKTI